MVDKRLVEATDVTGFKNDVMTWILSPPPPVKSDVVLPVYLVVDESGAIDPNLLNAGVRDLVVGLLG